MRSRPWAVVAWALAGVGWAFAAAAVILALATGHDPTALADWVMDIVVAVVYGLVVVTLLPRTRHPVVWIVAVAAWGCAIAAFAEGYVALEATLPGENLAFYARFWTWIPGVYSLVVVVPLIVVSRWSRWRLPVLAAGAVAVLLAMLPGMTVVVPGLPPNPLGIDAAGWQSFIRSLASWPDRTVALIGALEAGWLALRVRRTPRPDRRGLGWLLAGHTAMVAALVVFLMPMPADVAEQVAAVSSTLLLLAQVFLPGALLVLVLGRQLWGVDATVDRTTVWVVMTASVALAYLLLVAFAAQLLPSHSDLAVGIAVGLVGLGSAPLRGLVQQQVDTLVYGPGADPARLWSRLEGAGAHDLDGLASALGAGLQLKNVRIVPDADAVTLPGHATDVTIPVASRGRTVGVLVATPRTGERLDRRTVGMLEQVAGLVGMTIDLLQANEALAGARHRMGSIRLEERRLLRRDLHDGLGPALAGIRLGLVAARDLSDRDPEAARDMLDTLVVELGRQGEDVRRLSRSLLPLAIDDGDLAGALAGLAQRFGDEELAVRVTVADDVDLPPPAQVAVYHLVSEALLNVRRHAQARHGEVVVRRRHDDGTLVVVSDDGVGLEPDVAEGVGLRSMRERAEELGGSLEVTATEGRGSRVTLRLPPSLV